ncbi:Ribulose-1 [Diplonema papillatum]|nr:Ribulose-1 [Diplonema papillatum]
MSFACALRSVLLLLCWAHAANSIRPSEPRTTSHVETIRIFNKWFASRYNKDAKKPLQLVVNKTVDVGGGYGVYATEDIAAGTPYLRIPNRLLFSLDFLERERSPVATVLKEAKVTHSLLKLNILLQYERFVKGPESYFHDYISIIPHEMDTPSYYTKAEMAELKGTRIEELTEVETKKWWKTFGRLKKDLFATRPRMFPVEVFTWSNFKWAQNIMHTRTIWTDGRPNLIPFLDMINCQELPDPDRIHKTVAEDGHAVTYAPWEFKKGQQVFENYGQKNRHYFVHHGFSLERNSQDCLDLLILPFVEKVLLKSATEDVRRIFFDTIIKHQLPYSLDKEFCLKPTGIPDEAMQTLRIVALLKSGRNSLHYDIRLSPPPKVEAAAHDLVIDWCHFFLEGFRTSHEEDEELLKEEGLSFRFRQIVKYRLAQKRLAVAVVRYVDLLARAELARKVVTGTVNYDEAPKDGFWIDEQK